MTENFDKDRLEQWRQNVLPVKSAERLKSLANSAGYDCSCGKGRLGPKQYNDGQFMGGFTVSRKCEKCGMLHFFQL